MEKKCCETCMYHYMGGVYNAPKCFPYYNDICKDKTKSDFNKFRKGRRNE